MKSPVRLPESRVSSEFSAAKPRTDLWTESANFEAKQLAVCCPSSESATSRMQAGIVRFRLNNLFTLEPITDLDLRKNLKINYERSFKQAQTKTGVKTVKNKIL